VPCFKHELCGKKAGDAIGSNIQSTEIHGVIHVFCTTRQGYSHDNLDGRNFDKFGMDASHHRDLQESHMKKKFDPKSFRQTV